MQVFVSGATFTAVTSSNIFQTETTTSDWAITFSHDRLLLYFCEIIKGVYMLVKL